MKLTVIFFTLVICFSMRTQAAQVVGVESCDSVSSAHLEMMAENLDENTLALAVSYARDQEINENQWALSPRACEFFEVTDQLLQVTEYSTETIAICMALAPEPVFTKTTAVALVLGKLGLRTLKMVVQHHKSECDEIRQSTRNSAEIKVEVERRVQEAIQQYISEKKKK
ncbi:hypothetical protein [Bdellovibrio reynosensis]|uniref:Uncharacterized protein n=1 Tax=Bdellovibrio reynosensis TaxID=2835041 RepID=A0ABY4CCX8_9BACT|nr:hypothetical protein [Bdellovibrio reynosensis]UOF02760.1 hypothetical protein MNR06_07325 [Bdellovibrio reynosensis]